MITCDQWDLVYTHLSNLTLYAEFVRDCKFHHPYLRSRSKNNINIIIWFLKVRTFKSKKKLTQISRYIYYISLKRVKVAKALIKIPSAPLTSNF